MGSVGSYQSPPPPTFTADQFAWYDPTPGPTELADSPDRPDPYELPPPTPSPTPKPTAKPTPKPTDRPERARTKPPRVDRKAHNIVGKASWHATGRDGMYGAACKPLRDAIGPGWRGTAVIVEAVEGGGWVGVILNDYCASRDKTLDLSDEAFNKLTATKRYPDGRPSMGVIKVAIGW